MSVAALIARHEWRRLAVQPFAWILDAVVIALMAWQYLLALEAVLGLAQKLGGLKDAPGVTDLVAIPLLRSFSNLLMLLVPLITMRTIAGDMRQWQIQLREGVTTSALAAALVERGVGLEELRAETSALDDIFMSIAAAETTAAAA